MSFNDLREKIRTDYGKSVASIRVSVGIATNFADVDALVRFVAGFRDRSAAEVGPPSECVTCQPERQVV